jgi:hypothetical protein
MNSLLRAAALGTLGMAICFASTSSHAAEDKKTMSCESNRIKGSFEVKLAPQTPSEPAKSANLGRMTLDKRFHGDLDAGSQGEMLAFMTATEGSAGYVAIERVTGSLCGRKGSFVLQHNGIMARGKPQLTVAVVPDSGTEQLTGLSGTMKIDIVDGKHFYEFEYALPAAGK